MSYIYIQCRKQYVPSETIMRPEQTHRIGDVEVPLYMFVEVYLHVKASHQTRLRGCTYTLRTRFGSRQDRPTGQIERENDA